MVRNFNNRNRLLWFPLMRNRSTSALNSCSNRRLFRLEYGPHCRWLPPQQVADLVGVSIKTVYKWMNGTHPMDERARQVLYTRVLGLLPCDRWRGWHIDETGRLTAPNGYAFYPDELMALSWLKQLNGALSADVARLSVENRQLRDALDYLQRSRPPGNVVDFPFRHKKARLKTGQDLPTS